MKALKFVNFVEDHRLFAVLILMLFIWSSLLGFLLIKTDEITKDPCSICSKKIGSDVICTTTDSFIPITKTFYQNETITINEDKIGNTSQLIGAKQYPDLKVE